MSTSIRIGVIDVTHDNCVDCVREEAPKPNKALRHDRCHRHYEIAKAVGAITPRKRRPNGSPAPECAIDGCREDMKANDLCASHNARAWRGADLDAPFRGKRGDQCSFDGCENAEHGKGLCGGHYRQQLDGRPLTQLREFIDRDGTCEADGCDRDIANAGLCHRHYQRKLAGDPNWDRSIKAKAPNGSGHINSDGYKVIQVNGRRKMEHVYFVEQLLGRELIGKENVHHRNGSRADNRTDGAFVLSDRGNLMTGNLEIWSKKQPAGQEVGPKLDWMVEMADDYDEFVTEAMWQRMARSRTRGLIKQHLRAIDEMPNVDLVEQVEHVAEGWPIEVGDYLDQVISYVLVAREYGIDVRETPRSEISLGSIVIPPGFPGHVPPDNERGAA